MPVTRNSNASSSFKQNNPKGKNQYKDCPSPDDQHVIDVLRAYHRQGITDRRQLSKLLLKDHNIVMSESTIARRKRDFGLRASHLTTLEMDDITKRQLVLDQMAKDPQGKLGPRMIKRGIFKDTGLHLTVDWIKNEMRILDPEAYASRGPAHVKARRNAVETTLSPQMCPSIDSGSGSVPLPTSSSQLLHHEHVTSPRAPDIDFSDSDSEPEPIQPNVPESHRFSAQQNDYITAAISLSNPPPPSLIRPCTPESHTLQAFDRTHDFTDLPETLLFPLGVPSILTAVDIMERAAPKMTALTQFLSHITASRQALDPKAHDTVLKCMEAAAMLERQLARLASDCSSVH